MKEADMCDTDSVTLCSDGLPLNLTVLYGSSQIILENIIFRFDHQVTNQESRAINMKYQMGLFCVCCVI